MDKFTREFIETYREYIVNEDWECLYSTLEALQDIRLIPKLTRTLLEADINPLEGMGRVPDFFADGIKRLKAIIIPQGIKVIQNGAFEDTNLNSISIPNSVVEIQAHAFRDCPKLQTITIPASVKEIGSCAFLNVAAEQIKYLGTEKQWDQIKLGSRWWTNPNTITGFVICTDNTLQYPISNYLV